MAGRRRKTQEEPQDLVDQMAAEDNKPAKGPAVPDPITQVSGNGADYDSAAERLHSIVTRIERLDDEIALKKEDRKEVLAEAKGTGFSTKTIALVLKRRKRRRDDISEEEAMLQMYEEAIDSASGRA